MSGMTSFRFCPNCGEMHGFVGDWPGCDPTKYHGFMTYQGMEGRCQFCGSGPDGRLHQRGALPAKVVEVEVEDTGEFGIGLPRGYSREVFAAVKELLGDKPVVGTKVRITVEVVE